MANYNFYLARSLAAVNDSSISDMGFHLRIRKKNDSERDTPPFLHFEDSTPRIEVQRTTNAGLTNYVISVWLKEDTQDNQLIRKDDVFKESNPPDYTNISAQIIAHINKSGTYHIYETSSDPTNDNGNDLVYDEMPAESPAGLSS